MLTIAGTQVLLNRYHSTAHQLEVQASEMARLRADVNQYTSFITASQLPSEPRQAAALASAVTADFAELKANSPSAETEASVAQGSAAWVEFLRGVAAVDPTLPMSQRYDALVKIIGAQLTQITTAIDKAGAVSRAAARTTLARSQRTQSLALAGWIAAYLVALMMMFRLARRLTVEVLTPVSLLRASANQLAAGDLSHRVQVIRHDEIGDLATSFNSMADAVAGTHQSLHRQAHHDALTGLPNRAAFQARAVTALSWPARRAGTQAIMFIDLDDFKDVNDVLGHEAGDELLCLVADRLRDVLRPGDLVARLGGDEFAVLLEGIPDATTATALAERTVTALAAPCIVQGHPVKVGASIGVAMQQPDSDLATLMRQADIAMYSAKAHGKNCVQRYDPTLHTAVAEHQSMKNDVLLAASNNELVLQYQPVLNLRTGELIGVEALVRWQHPTRGLLPPSAFIQLAEDTDAILDIGSWVLRTSAQQVQSWQRRYQLPNLQLAVNVSVRQLETPGFADLVRDVLSKTPFDPSNLILEVTESVLADPDGDVAAHLAHLRQSGVRIALDDFGTGYSSIGYLRQLPIDILKIDRSFVSGSDAHGDNGRLLEAIVGLGQHLGLDLIPEGIETPADLSAVQALGCATGQGFLLSRPINSDDIDHWLANGTRPVFPIQPTHSTTSTDSVQVPTPRPWNRSSV